MGYPKQFWIGMAFFILGLLMIWLGPLIRSGEVGGTRSTDLNMVAFGVGMAAFAVSCTTLAINIHEFRVALREIKEGNRKLSEQHERMIQHLDKITGVLDRMDWRWGKILKRLNKGG
jgi:hypothetical protein